MSNIHFSGTPTAPAVSKLMEAHGPLEVNAVIKHETIEAACFENRKSDRYRTVVKAWKNEVWNKTGMVIESLPRIGYQVLDNHKRVTHATRLQRHGIKRIRRGATVAVNTDKDGLSDDEKKAIERAALIHASLRLSELVKPKQII